MRTPYERGRNAEYAVKRMLQEMGYRWVIRSAASHSPIDLLASNGVETLAVQCKVGGYISAEEKTSLVEWALKLNARPCLARKNRSGRWVVLDVDADILDFFEAAA
jgi:Holliday junction resolvase